MTCPWFHKLSKINFGLNQPQQRKMLQFLSLWIHVQKSNWTTHWEIQEMLFITETHGLKKTILRNYLHIVFERNANRNSPASAHPSGMLTMSSLFGSWNLPLNKHDKSTEQKTSWQTLIRERESGRNHHPFHNITNEPEARGVLQGFLQCWEKQQLCAAPLPPITFPTQYFMLENLK